MLPRPRMTAVEVKPGRQITQSEGGPDPDLRRAEPEFCWSNELGEQGIQAGVHVSGSSFCFVPVSFILAGWLRLAKSLQSACFSLLVLRLQLCAATLRAGGF